MAGDWIKVEKATARKDEVLIIADRLGIHPDQALGLCIRFWVWCDDGMVDGHARRVTNVTLDAVFGHAGFVDALLFVDWLRVRDGSLEVPNFDRHMSESAKNRALSGIRQQKRRAKDVTKMSRLHRDKSVTREEKSITPLPPKGEFAVNEKRRKREQFNEPPAERTENALHAWIRQHGESVIPRDRATVAAIVRAGATYSDPNEFLSAVAKISKGDLG